MLCMCGVAGKIAGSLIATSPGLGEECCSKIQLRDDGIEPSIINRLVQFLDLKAGVAMFSSAFLMTCNGI